MDIYLNFSCKVDVSKFFLLQLIDFSDTMIMQNDVPDYLCLTRWFFGMQDDHLVKMDTRKRTRKDDIESAWTVI